MDGINGVEVAKVLIESGADVNIADKDGQYAATWGCAGQTDVGNGKIFDRKRCRCQYR